LCLGLFENRKGNRKMKQYLGNKLTKEEVINNLKSYDLIFVEFDNYEKFIELFKAIEELGYQSDWTEDENEVLNLKVIEEDLKGYKSLWLNIDNKKKFISLSTFYNVHKEVRVYSNKNVAYGTMLEKLEYIR
jgi:hypothetical protein